MDGANCVVLEANNSHYMFDNNENMGSEGSCTHIKTRTNSLLVSKLLYKVHFLTLNKRQRTEVENFKQRSNVAGDRLCASIGCVLNLWQRYEQHSGDVS